MSDGPRKPLVRSLALAPELDELKRARRFVSRAAAEAGFSEARVFDITVASSEAVANAVEHAPVKGEVLVKTILRPDRLEVHVEGPGEFQAPQRLTDGHAHRGLGLPLMATFSDHLALYSGPRGGTLVSLTFYLPGMEPSGGAPLPPTSKAPAREAEGTYRELLETMWDGICVCELVRDDQGNAVDWRFLDINESGARIFGARPDQARGRPRLEVVPDPDDWWLGTASAVVENGTPVCFQRHVPSCDLWLEATVFASGDDVFTVVYDDITERKCAEESFQAVLTRTEVLRAIAAKAAETSDVRSLAAEVLDICRELLEAKTGLVHEADEHAGVLRALALTGYPEEFNNLVQVLAFDDPVAPSAIAYRGDTVLTYDSPLVPPDVKAREELAGITTFRWVALPIHVKGEVIGSLGLTFGKRRPFEREELALFVAVADQLGVGIARARVESALRRSEERYRGLAEENERLYRQQLDIAENLQFALLNIPSDIGRVKLGHLYRSATQAARVGGDFYDVYEAKDGNIAILMGDVAGHGIQAARAGTLVKDVVYAFTHQSLRTHEVLRRTNHLLIAKELPGFVTLFLGILDPRAGLLRYSSAGHPESMIKRASGGIEMLGSGTSPLGVYPDATWRLHEIALQPNDVLLLYTDGVTEARRDGELFGEKRLERLLKRKRISVGRLPHLILDEVLAFSGGALHDDAAVLAVSLTELQGDIPRKAGPVQQKLLDG